MQTRIRTHATDEMEHGMAARGGRSPEAATSVPYSHAPMPMPMPMSAPMPASPEKKDRKSLLGNLFGSKRNKSSS